MPKLDPGEHGRNTLMSKKAKAKQLAGYSFLFEFANDDTIDEEELAMIERMALEDHEVDADEKEALRNIFSRIKQDTIAKRVRDEINEFRAKYGV